jgi:hypothetical protein
MHYHSINMKSNNNGVTVFQCGFNDELRLTTQAT